MATAIPLAVRESITISPAPLALTTTSLPSGTVGVTYSSTIGVAGGTSPYSCVFTVGTLPAGLSLSGLHRQRHTHCCRHGEPYGEGDGQQRQYR